MKQIQLENNVNITTENEEEDQSLFQEEYESLLRALQWTDSFGLFFVTCSFEQCDKLFQNIIKELTNKKIKILSFEDEVYNLYEIVDNLLKQETIDILMIRGLEYSLYEYEEKTFTGDDSSDRYLYSWKGVPRILGHLNLQRERFRDNFPISFIFCVPEFVLNYFIRRAPDFFDWRSGVFDLEFYLGYARQYGDIKGEDIKTLLSAKSFIVEKNRDFYDQSLQLFLSQRYDLCIKMSDKVLELQPDSFECLYIKAKALDRLYRKHEANDCYLKILDLKIDSFWKRDKIKEILA